MELTFNELSQTPLLEDKHSANARMLLFAKAVAAARKNGFRKIRTHSASTEIKLTENYSLYNWMLDKEFPAVNRELFYDLLVQPFISEDDNEAEKRYVEANYYFEDTDERIPKQACLGLTSAFLNNTIAASFQSTPAWLKNELNLTVEKDGETSLEQVKHIFSDACFDVGSIRDFVEQIGELILGETEIDPTEKRFHLAPHHGQQELSNLWNRIRNSPYIIEGMSIGWGGNTFYKNPTRDGKLDIVHLKSDRRYALQVQTTGRNLRETIEIGKRLADKYG